MRKDTIAIVLSVLAAGFGLYAILATGGFHFGGFSGGAFNNPPVGTVFFDATSTTQTVTNTSTITTVYTKTIPGNYLGTKGGVLRINAKGTLFNNSSSSASLTWTLTYGGSTCVSVGGGAVASSSNTGGWGIIASLANVSSSAAFQTCELFSTIKGGGTATLNAGSGSPTTVDSTADQTLLFRLTTSVASTTVTAQLTNINLYFDKVY